MLFPATLQLTFMSPSTTTNFYNLTHESLKKLQVVLFILNLEQRLKVFPDIHPRRASHCQGSSVTSPNHQPPRHRAAADDAAD